jgi:serine/threonine protein kinase
MQGGLEFKTEIELLSRVHNKNLVGLIGFCFEKGERMLVYEFIPNGTLNEALYGRFFHLICLNCLNDACKNCYTAIFVNHMSTSWTYHNILL